MTEVAVEGACGAAIVADATPANVTSIVTSRSHVGGTDCRGGSKSTVDWGCWRRLHDLEGSVWLDGTLFVGDRRRAANGYPVCTLSRRARTLRAHAPARTSSSSPSHLLLPFARPRPRL